jgi:hypothetical protein
MNWKRALVLVAVAGGAIPAAASETDLSWIGKLPGLQAQASRTTSTDGYKAIYTLTGDAGATLDSVRNGLTERGWTIQKSTDVPAGSADVRTLAAGKQGARLKVSIASALGVGTLTVELRGGEPGSGATGEAAVVAGGSGGKATVAVPGAGLVVAGSRVTETHDCNDGDVSVNGNSSGITLKGTCRTVTVAGNSNTVTIRGSVQAITAVGRANTVIWSADKNPRAPVVKHVGSQNRVVSDAE